MDEKNTCPDCKGTGKDEKEGQCPLCMGEGKYFGFGNTSKVRKKK